MNFTKVHNPTDAEVALQFLGTTYTIGGGETADFPEDVAKQWVTIYGFMTITGPAEVDKVAEDDVVEEKITKPKVAKKK